MLPAERKRKIVELVTARDGCAVDDLATELDFSKATIRRDLRQLEDDGLIERSHGGAVPVTAVGREQSYGQRDVQRLEQKAAIAEVAVEQIRPGQVVFFDAGTTTMQVGKRAPKDGSFLAVTNSPLLAMELTSDENEVKLTGGTLRRRTRALVGPSATGFMERMNFDLLFLGTNAIDSDGGLSTPNEDEALVKEVMIERAARVVLVADGSKVGKRSFIEFADLEGVDVFITDRSLTRAEQETFDAADVAVLETPE
ncbi:MULTISPECIES: HTH-type transcriptional regulator GlpR [unclassified Haladaptatus]|uniref:HTH-type transcriptional regulator GlpR n=1 Tax=unclassified Haladaptatus TaxID=2622732 RepID=UPI0023E88718|nr:MULTISPECIES: HTH-type transcriptional regulator GlpR [unclassified Haladaptatus]